MWLCRLRPANCKEFSSVLTSLTRSLFNGSDRRFISDQKMGLEELNGIADGLLNDLGSGISFVYNIIFRLLLYLRLKPVVLAVTNLNVII